MIQCSAYGRLGADPKERETKAGKAMATASIAVDVAAYDAAGEVTMWLSVAAFGKVADQLLRHAKGDLLAVMGRLTLRQWQDREGRERETWSLLAESLHSSRTVRPGGKRKADSKQAAFNMQAPNDAGRPFNDELPP